MSNREPFEVRDRLEREIAELRKRIIWTDDEDEKRALSEQLEHLEAQLEESR